MSPQTTQLIAQAEGIYLIGWKTNQPELFQMMEKNISYLPSVNEQLTFDKGHGRMEKRHYFKYVIVWECVDERWQDSGFQYLYQVKCKMLDYRTGKK